MKYKISIKTGNISRAGTDADVSIQIFGANLSTKELLFSSKLKHFERGQTDDFFIDTDDLGEIEKIKIWHNNKLFGPDWFLDEIYIESHLNNKLWYFPVFKWIKGDQILTVTSKKHCKYQFEIFTGTLPGSGSKDLVQISLVGSRSYTHFIQINEYLHNGEFKTGHTDLFSLIAEDVGKIQEIHIKSSSASFNSTWFLSKIRMKNTINNKYLSFPFHQWVIPGQTLRSSTELIEYTIKFYTGNVAEGGTDANVKIIIFGSRGETNPIELNKLIARNAFEAGKTDYIKLAHKNLGSIKKIKIWHDEKWLGDGWFLNKISIKNDETGIEAEFPYYSWLDKSADPRSTKIEISRIPIKSRPFYAIAHMVNTPAYVEEALDLGSNAIEFDITPIQEENGKFSFEVFHGFRPDFDPDKINLMERSMARTPLKLFIENLKYFEEKYKKFTLAIYDCKIDKINKNSLESCGYQLGKEVIQYFYMNTDDNRIFTIFSIAKKKSHPFFDGLVSAIPDELKRYIGFDLSMENFQTTEKVFEKRLENNFWWGRGIASTVPKPLKHFIPQFLIAAKKRTNREIIKKIYYWTLDDPDSMARILVTKLDGIIVNDPLNLLNVLEKEEFKHTYRLANRNDNPFVAV